MLEIPEAIVISEQASKTLTGKKIVSVETEKTPHKLVWFYGDKTSFNQLLNGRTITGASSAGGLVEIFTGGVNLLFGDGANLRFHPTIDEVPDKRQLLIRFEDSSYISAGVQMYGGMGVFKEGELDNPYYIKAKEKISPLSDKFDRTYFLSLISAPAIAKLSVKAFLATEQRIPGLGNGVLQDILYNAKIHPKRKINTFSEEMKTVLFQSIKDTLKEMTEKGGRDIEKDLFGNPGGYVTKLSKNTTGKPCPLCGTLIKKEAYLGGSIYFCGTCQK